MIRQWIDGDRVYFKVLGREGRDITRTVAHIGYFNYKEQGQVIYDKVGNLERVLKRLDKYVSKEVEA